MIASKKLIWSFIIVLFSSSILFCFNSGGPGEEEYMAFAETMPAPVNGLNEIYKNITYPKMAQMAGVEGKVFVLAFIDETGVCRDVKVIKGLGYGCDEAVCEAVKKAKYTPGVMKGVPVKVKLSLAVVFKLP